MKILIRHALRFAGRQSSRLAFIPRALLCLAAAAQFAAPASANDFRLGPLINLSDPDVLAACGSNGAERETPLAINPTNPKNIVTAWIGGGFKGIGTAVSFDGGRKFIAEPARDGNGRRSFAAGGSRADLDRERRIRGGVCPPGIAGFR